MKTEMTDPNIWLQQDEASGTFDQCACRLDATGPDGEEGAAFYMCPMHEAAPELLEALRTLVSTLDEDACTCDERSWRGEGHDSACPLTYLDDARAAIAAAEGKV